MESSGGQPSDFVVTKRSLESNVWSKISVVVINHMMQHVNSTFSDVAFPVFIII